MCFNAILKRKREESGMTQEDVAARLGITRQNVSSYESGLKTPSLRIIVAMADLFRCSVDEMIGRKIS